MIEKLKYDKKDPIGHLYQKLNEIVDYINNEPKPLLVIKMPNNVPMEIIQSSYQQLEAKGIADDYHIIISHHNEDTPEIKFELLSTKDLKRGEMVYIKQQIDSLAKITENRMVVVKIPSIDLESKPLHEVLFKEDKVEIDFNGDLKIEISKNKDAGWHISNAMDGWGRNCLKEVVNEKVTVEFIN